MGSFWLYYCALSCFIWVSLKPFVSLRGGLKIFCGLRAFLCTLCDKGACVKAEKEQPNLQRVKLCYSFCPQWSSKETGQRGLCFCCVACCFCFLLAELKGSIHLCLSRCSLGSPWPCRTCGVQVLWGKQEPFRWGCAACTAVRSLRSPGRAGGSAVSQGLTRLFPAGTQPLGPSWAPWQLLSAHCPTQRAGGEGSVAYCTEPGRKRWQRCVPPQGTGVTDLRDT